MLTHVDTPQGWNFCSDDVVTAQGRCDVATVVASWFAPMRLQGVYSWGCVGGVVSDFITLGWSQESARALMFDPFVDSIYPTT